MFGEAGFAYVYFTYGNHWCLNVTAEGDGEAGAVLIRAGSPLKGVEQMKARRGGKELAQLTNGPGKLTQAMGIDGTFNGEDLVNSKRLYLFRGPTPEKIGVSVRIGLSVARDTPWRYYDEGDPFVSGGRTYNYRTGIPSQRGVVG